MNSAIRTSVAGLRTRSFGYCSPSLFPLHETKIHSSKQS